MSSVLENTVSTVNVQHQRRERYRAAYHPRAAAHEIAAAVASTGQRVAAGNAATAACGKWIFAFTPIWSTLALRRSQVLVYSGMCMCITWCYNNNNSTIKNNDSKSTTCSKGGTVAERRFPFRKKVGTCDKETKYTKSSCEKGHVSITCVVCHDQSTSPFCRI